MRNKSLLRAKDISLGKIPLNLPPPVTQETTLKWRYADMPDVCDIVCNTIGVPEDFLHNKSRKLPIPVIRYYCYYYGYMFTRMPHAELSRYFADFETHIASWHGARVVENLIAVNANIRKLDGYILSLFINAKFYPYAKTSSYRRVVAIQKDFRIQIPV